MNETIKPLAIAIFEKHWIIATKKPLDEATKHHMKYAIEAVNEALDLKESANNYIPQYTYDEDEVRELLHKRIELLFGISYDKEITNKWFNEHKKNRL